MMRAIAVIVLSVLLAAPAHANMTIAAHAAGGLVPVRNDDIGIEREDLYISPELVRVKYLLRSDAENAVRAPVLFPLPELDTRLYAADAYVFSVRDDAPPILRVSVRVDGRALDVAWEQRAYDRSGVEVTARLRELGLGLIGNDTDNAVKAMPAHRRDALLAEGLVLADVYGSEPQSKVYYAPNWILRGGYRWVQEFAAKAVTTVEVEYEPFTGGVTRYGGIDTNAAPADVEAELGMRAARREIFPWHEEYCLKAEHVRAISRLNAPDDEPSGLVRWTRYILVTATNWAGPIKDFRLTVDKLTPDAVVAFCAPDGKAPIRQTGPTTYEVTIRDFVPSRNFSMLTFSGGE